jgi:hypothetical protein
MAAIGESELRFHTGRTGRNGKDFFLHIPFAEITDIAVDAHAGTMTVTSGELEAPVVYHLGKHAADWKKMIEERPTPVDELGVKAGVKVALVNIDDDELLADLESRVKGGFAGDDATDLDLLFVSVEHKQDLAQLGTLARRVKRPGGTIWVVYSTRARTLDGPAIGAAGRGAGLIDGDTVDFTRTKKAVRLTRM